MVSLARCKLLRAIARILQYWLSPVMILENVLVGSKIFRPDIQKPRQMENAVRDT